MVRVSPLQEGDPARFYPQIAHVRYPQIAQIQQMTCY
jgi:hypothetical protein